MASFFDSLLNLFRRHPKNDVNKEERKTPADFSRNKKKEEDRNSINEKTKKSLYALGISGVLGPILYAMQVWPSWHDMISILSVAFMIGMASLLAGGLIGFLFGIPRTLQNLNAGGEGEEKGRPDTAYAANTNLEQISDWLTKILVGIGLAEFGEIRSALGEFMKLAKPGLGDFSHSGMFAAAVLIYFLIGGFLISYLLTRIYLAQELAKADTASKLAKVEKKLSDFEQQAENDTKALALVQRVLNPTPGSPPLVQEELNELVNRASVTARRQIFFQAQEMRWDNWEDPGKKFKMERSIPIFRALIASDTEKAYHANHGQLGYALKDQRTPDYAAAADALTTAINRRGSWEKSGWLMYEANRAICRIHTDKNFNSVPKLRSDAAAAQLIKADLDAANMVGELSEWLAQDPVVVQWRALNA